jgi:MFS family permease
MMPFATFPALLPVLMKAWGLHHSEAGLISGSFFGGYMAAVPVLVSLTDRVDARRVYGFATMLSAGGTLGFALYANGLWSGFFFQALAGAGLAGTYMPGLKILSDHISGPRQSRAIALYTSTFGIGTSLSLWFAGTVASMSGWPWAFGLAACGPVAAGILVFIGIRPRQPPRPTAPQPALLDFRPVFRNREAIRYIFGYAAHCWELFGFRSWIVAFFAICLGSGADLTETLAGAAALAAIVNLLGPAASILGNELASIADRRRVIMWMMAASSTLACLVGFGVQLPWYFAFAGMVIYFTAIMSDSAALTAGVVAAAAPHQRGATMALHSLLGFGAGFVAPVIFGVVLDLLGGEVSGLAWGGAFASLALGYVIVLPMLWWSRARARSAARRRA